MATEIKEPAEKLYKILSEEYRVYQELQQLGNKKQEALIENELEDLAEIVEAETDLMDNVDNLEAARLQLIESIATDLDQSAEELSFNQLLPELPEAKKDAFSELRGELLELIEDLNALNESNRQLLMEALKFNEFSMKAVIGSENQQTYENPGKAGKNNKSNRIINRQA